LDLLPLEGRTVSEDGETLDVLPRGLEQLARDLRGDRRVAKGEQGALDSERRPVNGRELGRDAARPDTDHTLREGARQCEDRADRMGRVVHRRQTLPVAGPTRHLLVVRTAKKLDASDRAVVHELPNMEELA